LRCEVTSVKIGSPSRFVRLNSPETRKSIFSYPSMKPMRKMGWVGYFLRTILGMVSSISAMELSGKNSNFLCDIGASRFVRTMQPLLASVRISISVHNA